MSKPVEISAERCPWCKVEVEKAIPKVYFRCIHPLQGNTTRCDKPCLIKDMVNCPLVKGLVEALRVEDVESREV